MSDVIAAYIMDRMEEESRDFVELQRNSLATEIGCAPSQINYVLSSRFTPEQGYIVESRRGGGGYIRVQRVRFSSKRSMIMHIVNAIGEALSESSAVAIIQNLYHEGLIERQTAYAMSAAVSERALYNVYPRDREVLRSAILRHMLVSVTDDNNG